MAGKFCQICNKPSGIYPLCKEHLKLKEEGKVFKNNETGKWELKKEQTKHTQKKDDITNHTSCLICGNTTENSFLFCKKCYNEYKNKSILIKVTNCTQTEFVCTIDKYESGLTIKCKDGHIVRSKSEMTIDNYLYDHNIKHAYEKAYPISANKDEDLHPDFYLPELDLYIEHWGYANKANYKEEKEYKTKIYNRNRTTVIGTTEEDMQDIETALDRKLNPKNYVKGKVNF